MLREEVFSEEALGELPGFVEGAGFFEEAVNPVDFEFGVGGFDSFACDGVVFHDFSCAAVAVDVCLEVDDVSGFGDSEVVLVDEGVDLGFGEEGHEEGGEVAVVLWSDGTVHQVYGDEAERVGWPIGAP